MLFSLSPTYQTFISYRRKGGKEYAERLYDYLLDKNFSPFYDITGMEAGRFDEQIRLRLINAKNYILILSKGALDRVCEPDDWVRKEIQLAIENNLNIIVLQETGFVYPDLMPDDIINIKNYQVLEFDSRTFTKQFPVITSQLILQKDEFDTFDPLDGRSPDLSGNYLTLYEDYDNGRKVIIKAPATLKVFCNHISGTTSFGSQKWKLSARLYKRKRIAGIYYARNVLDDGLGTFFLEVKSPSVLEGFWCGYDNVSRQISSGKYLFKKIYTDYSVREMKYSDFGQVIKIADAQLGKDYVTPQMLNGMLEESSTMRCDVVEDKGRGKVIGFSIYDIIDYDKVLELTRGSAVRELMYTKKIGYLKTIAIDRHFSGFGIASEVVKHSVEAMNRQGADSIISTAWKHGGVINIENVLKRNGFVQQREIANYWYEASIKENFMCPQCGNPCHCSCVIFIKC